MLTCLAMQWELPRLKWKKVIKKTTRCYFLSSVVLCDVFFFSRRCWNDEKGMSRSRQRFSAAGSLLSLQPHRAISCMVDVTSARVLLLDRLQIGRHAHGVTPYPPLSDTWWNVAPKTVLCSAEKPRLPSLVRQIPGCDIKSDGWRGSPGPRAFSLVHKFFLFFFSHKEKSFHQRDVFFLFFEHLYCSFRSHSGWKIKKKNTLLVWELEKYLLLLH